MLTVIRIAAVGTLGYLTPRVLVGVGVPLDEWAVAFGTWLGLSRPWVEEWGLTTVAVICAIALSGIEAWWHPLKRSWNGIFAKVRNISSAADTYSNADLDEWRHVDPLELWRAGCLWKGYKPHYPMPFLDPAYPSFIKLVNAAKAGQLTLAQSGVKVDAWSLVNRNELARFANSRSDIPEFLRDIDLDAEEAEQYIDLNEAALRAYEETEETAVAHFAEMTMPNGSRAVLSWYAYAFVGRGSDTPIFGKQPPSRKRRQIPSEEFPRCSFSDDARTLHRYGAKEPRYVELEIRKSDFERRLAEIKSWNGE